MATKKPPTWNQILHTAINRQLGIINANVPLPTYPKPPSTQDLEDNRIDPSTYAQYLMNPEAYASSAANAAYDTSIATLSREQGHVMPQSAQNQADLTNWFKQTTDTYNKGAAASKADLAKNISGLTDASSAFMSALGGSANPGNQGIAQSALEAQGGLAGQGFANSSFDADMQGIMGLQGTQEHVNEKNRASKMLEDLTFQLSNMQHEKGAFYGEKLAEGNETRFGQQTSLDNTKFQQAQDILNARFNNTKYTSDTLQQRFDNILNRNNANSNNITSLFNNVLAAKQLPGSLALTNAQIRNVNASTDKLNADIADINNGNKIDLTDPKQAGSVETSVRNAISGPGGQFSMDPAVAYKMAQNQLARYGITGAAANAFLSSIFRDVLQTSHAHGKWIGYEIGKDGQIHRTHVVQKAAKALTGVLGRGGTPKAPKKTVLTAAQVKKAKKIANKPHGLRPPPPT